MKARLVESSDGKEYPLVFPHEVVELSILMSGEQIGRIERVARTHGLTVAQWIRRLIQGCLPGETAGQAMS